MSIVGITCQRDDGAYLVEWLAHHLAAGFDRMLVLSHDCSDGSDDVLQALSADPRIAHLPFEPRGKKSVQWQALKLARQHPWVDAADWVLFFDCDEFICLQEGDLPSLISEFEAEQGSFDAIALPWRFFWLGRASAARARYHARAIFKDSTGRSALPFSPPF